MAVYDCFLYSGEVDLLRLRLAELDDVVDRFVLLECTSTFTGDPKELTFIEDRKSLGGLADRVTHVVVEDAPVGGNPWLSEFFQRDSLMRGLVDARDDDLVVLGDADEFMRREVPEKLRELPRGRVAKLALAPYNYGFNWRFRRPYVRPFVVRAATLRLSTPQELRAMSAPDEVLEDAGWHFSNFYRRDDILERLRIKIGQLSHTEFNNQNFTDEEYLRLCVYGGVNWSTIPPFRIKMDFVPIGPHLPNALLENPEPWGDYIWSEADRNLEAERRAERLHRQQILKDTLAPVTARLRRLRPRRFTASR